MVFTSGFFSVIYVVALFEIHFYLASCRKNDNYGGGSNDCNYCPQYLVLQYRGADLNIKQISQKNVTSAKSIAALFDPTEPVIIKKLDANSYGVFSVARVNNISVQSGFFVDGKRYAFYSYQVYFDCAENGNGGLSYNNGEMKSPVFISYVYYDESSYACIEDAIKENGIALAQVTAFVNSTSRYNPEFQDFLNLLNIVQISDQSQVESTYEKAAKWTYTKDLPHERDYFGYCAEFEYSSGGNRETGTAPATVQDPQYDISISLNQFAGLCRMMDPDNQLLTPRPALMSQGNPPTELYHGKVEEDYS